MNSEEGHKIRNLLQSLLQLPSYLSDEESHDVDLDMVVAMAGDNVKQIDEYVKYLDTGRGDA